LKFYIYIFRSNKYVANYVIVDIDKCAQTSVIVQVTFLLLLPKTYFVVKLMF